MAREVAEFPQGGTLVFGGSGGLGSEIARAFARAGSDVAIAYRSRSEVAEVVAADIRGIGQSASVHQTDVTQPQRVQQAVADAIDSHGRIHTVVYGAAPLAEQVLIGETSPQQWERAVNTETTGFFNVVSAVLPHLRESGGGSFVHLGSAGHLLWPARDGLSVVPKAANEALVKGIAKEEGVHNIRANTVLVGVIDAGMFHTLMEQGAFDQAWIEQTQRMLALKRWGQPEEVGHAAVFLASNRAAYVTGQQINVSGGFGV